MPTKQAIRYPLAPLAALLNIQLHTPGGHHQPNTPEGLRLLAEHLNISHRTARRWLHDGLTPTQADHAACRAGHHPSLVWPTWHTDIEPEEETS